MIRHSRTSRDGIISQKAFTLVEVCVSLTIIGILIALFLPSIQSVRESARSVSCRNNLRMLGMSALGYESAHGLLPPGNLGFQDSIVFGRPEVERWEQDPSFEYYWKNTQHTAAIVLLLPYLEQEALYDSLPRELLDVRKLFVESFNGTPPVSWVGEFDQVDALSKFELSTCHCPSDGMGTELSGIQISMVGAQPIYFIEGNDSRDGYLGKQILDLAYVSQGTSYAGCSGAHSGGSVPNRQMTRYVGAFSCRTENGLQYISDGQSNTVLFGETLGYVENGKRIGGYVWCYGSLIRGRGNVPWGLKSHPTREEVNIFGDTRYSHISSFGSSHPFHVNTVFADGSVRAIHRGIEVATWYALTGAKDGIVTKNF